MVFDFATFGTPTKKAPTAPVKKEGFDFSSFGMSQPVLAKEKQIQQKFVADDQGIPRWRVPEEQIKTLGVATQGQITPKELVQSATRPVINLPLVLASGLKAATSIPSEIAKTYKTGAETRAQDYGGSKALGGLGTLGEAAISGVESVAAPFSTVGNTILGAIQAGVKKATGVDLDDKQAAKAHERLKEILNDPLENAGQLAETVYKLTQEEPQIIPTLLEGGRAGLAKKGVPAPDVIGNVGRGVLDVTKQVAKTAETGVQKVGGLLERAKPSFSDAITKEFDQFVQSKKSIDNKVKFFEEQRHVPVREIITEPEVYKGLKVKDATVNPDEAIDVLQNRVDVLMYAKGKILPEIDRFMPPIKKETVRAKAIQDYKVTELPPADQLAVIRDIDVQLAALPDEMSSVQWDQLRAKFRKAARDAKGIQKRDNEYSALENAVRDSVIDATDNLPFDTNREFAKLGNEIKNNLGTIEFLDKTLRGQKTKGGRLGGYVLRTIGAIAGGAKGGIWGALAGSEVGGAISRIMQNNQLGSSFKMKLIRNITDDPVVLREAERLLGKAQQTTRPLLGEPRTGAPRVQTTGGRTIKLPSGKVEPLKVPTGTPKPPLLGSQALMSLEKPPINLPGEIFGKPGQEYVGRRTDVPQFRGNPTISRQNTANKTMPIKANISDTIPPKKPLSTPILDKSKQVPKKTGILEKAKQVDSLTQEAKKYKSAEEFVKAQFNATDLQPLKPIKDRNTYIKALGFKNKLGEEFPEEWWAKKSTPNQYYHIGTEEITSFDKTKSRFDPRTRGGGISQINGMYLGRDPKALSEFYGMIIKDEIGKTPTISSFKMAPKWLDLSKTTDETQFLNEVAKKYGVKQGRTKEFGDALEKEVIARGYDGVRYFDPYATGEEFVLVKQPPVTSQLTDIWNKANKK